MIRSGLMLQLRLGLHWVMLSASMVLLFGCMANALWLTALMPFRWVHFDPQTAALTNNPWTWIVPAILCGLLAAHFLRRVVPEVFVLVLFSLCTFLAFVYGEFALLSYNNLYRNPERLAILDDLYGNRIDPCRTFELGESFDEAEAANRNLKNQWSKAVEVKDGERSVNQLALCNDPPVNPAFGYDNKCRTLQFDKATKEVVSIECFDGRILKLLK